MGESLSLHNQLRADLADNLSATMAASRLAVVAFALVSVDSSPLPVSADFDARFLLSLSLIDLAFVSEDYWPVEYKPMDAVIWTLLCGGITTLVFLGIYRFGLSQAGQTTASIAAFLITVGIQFGGAILYARTR
jgi:hypothetical protein